MTGYLEAIKTVVDKLSGLIWGKTQAAEGACLWQEKDGVIYFSVVTRGLTGEQWSRRFRSRGIRLSAGAEKKLRDPRAFKPVKKGLTLNMAVLKSEPLESNNTGYPCMYRVSSEGGLSGRDQEGIWDVYSEGWRRKLEEAPGEVACLMMEMFGQEEIGAMGLDAILVISDPFPRCGFDPWPNPFLVGGWLETLFAHGSCVFYAKYGFAFVLP